MTRASKAGREGAPPAGELASRPAGDLPLRTMRTAGAKDTAPGRKRKNIPRTFNRRPKPWLSPVLELPDYTSERMLNVRKEILGLSRADAARLFRVARNTIWDWETGYRRAPFSAYLAMRLLADSMKRQSSSDPWLQAGSPSAAIAGAGDVAGELAPVTLAAPDLASVMAGAAQVGRLGWRSRAIRVKERMRQFHAIYNAAWLVRDSWHRHALSRQERVWNFVNVLAKELRSCSDYEALIYAVADSLTSSPHGLPWEGD